MRKSTRSFALSAASAALVLAAVTGCGQARPEGQSESTVIQTEAVPAVTEAPIVIQTEAPQTEPETQPQTQAQTQAPETQAPETQAPETQAPQTQAPVPDALSEEEELNQLYEFADDEIGTRFANADMNVRQGPTTEGDNIVSSLDKGEEVTVIGETANWYEIYKAEDTVTGMTDLKGFVMKRYTSDTYEDAMAAQPDETTPSAPEQTAQPEAQNVEAQPVEAQPAEAAPAEPAIVQENSAPAAQASGPQVTVTSDANIRSDAYETATVVGVINSGTTVTQIGSADGWVQVDYNGVQGYIKASMVG